MKTCIEKDWTTKAGLRAVVAIHPMGHRCGYVAVPPEHKLHGEDYDNVEVDVHGGLTYSGSDRSEYPVAAAGMFWFGYDCAHLGDARDPDLMDDEHRKYANILSLRLGDDVIRSLDFCIDECESLAKQLVELGE
jgi:hypothetical protein